MHRLIVIISFLWLIPLAGQTQDRDLAKLFNNYKDVKGFEYEKGDANLNLDMDWDFGDFLNDLEAFYILSFDKSEGDISDLKHFESKFDKLLDKKGFKSILEVDSDGRIEVLRCEDAKGNPTDFILVAGGENDISFIWAAGR
ncbi:MAG: DUF4252 domain-containing protein [bacterium]|jgi:hypothetical protein